MPRSSSALLPFLPIVGAAAAVLLLNFYALGIRLFLPYPASPWEAGIITDAWRLSEGQAIYAASGDRATHMYGPLTTGLLAEIIRFSGPALEAGRLINAVSAIAVIVLVIVLFATSGFVATVVSAALLFAANSRSIFYFTETRPDMVAILFTTVALIAFYRGMEGAPKARRFAFTLIGSALLIAAVMFKQTAAAFAFVPLLVSLARRSAARDLPYTMMPVLAVLLAAMTIYFFHGAVWFFMVVEPAQYSLPPARVVRTGLEFLAAVPIFLIALLHWLSTDARESWRRPCVLWLLATTFIAVPACIAAAAKYGANTNSFIPALFCMGAFCVWRVPSGLAVLQDAARPLLARFVIGSVIAGLLFVHAFPSIGVITRSAIGAGHGVADRSAVIAEVRQLPGKVVSPDDPTIALVAKGFAGRSSVFEADRVNWNADRTQDLLKDIKDADYVILMHHAPQADGRVLVTETSSGNLEWWPKVKLLKEMGFTEDRFSSTTTPVYSLWRRSRSR